MTDHEHDDHKGDKGDRGERGPAGDTVEGPRGGPGIQGIIGLTGVGERGRTGDQGQHGQDGAVGKTGPTGHIGETGPAGATGASQSRRITVVAIFALVAFLVVAFGYQRLSDANERLEAANARDACFAMVLTDVVESLDEREALSSQTSSALREYVAAAVDGKVALADAFTLILAEGTTEEQAVAAIERAGAAIRAASEVGDAYDTLSSELAQVRREHPTPTTADINACR